MVMAVNMLRASLDIKCVLCLCARTFVVPFFPAFSRQNGVFVVASSFFDPLPHSAVLHFPRRRLYLAQKDGRIEGRTEGRRDREKEKRKEATYLCNITNKSR